MNSNRTDIFKSEKLCLKDVVDYNFSIPSYQRPYVWGDEQLKKIIDDFYKAYQNNNEQPYYISTLITKDNGKNGKTSELIDGQQRFTTLWLIALVITRLTKQQKSEIEQFLRKGDELRLSFEIRSEVYDYLKFQVEEDQRTNNNKIKDVESYPYLINISKAIKSIEGFIKDALSESKLAFEEELRNFGNYIYTKVYFIKNSTPRYADLNKLFSTINNSGVQLEQTDLLKANLLKVIGCNKMLYSKIWESCENMNNFFERNARSSFDQSNWAYIDLAKHIEFDSKIFVFNADKSLEPGTIEGGFNIENVAIDEIEDYSFSKKQSEDENREGSDEIYCRSIINFSQLLLHTYRLHLKKEKEKDFDGTFHANRLIEVFREMQDRNDAEEVKRFFQLLWSVRYLFDKYVIKWISNTSTKNESLELTNFTRIEKNYISRTPSEKSESLMLQSVLYFTGDYLRQYWLSSYLDYLYYNHDNENPTSQKHLEYLEKIDNIFSLVKDIGDKELSWKLMHQTAGFDFNFDYISYLNQPNGTNFKHYWFYKLEYLLWKEWKESLRKDDEKFKKYRITSKNSIEHIYPQHPENFNQHPLIDETSLHSFGNLVLLSVSQNSEYSNKSVENKNVMFKEKNDPYDTLKSYFIFNKVDSAGWDPKQIEKHKDEMIALFEKHYNYA